jgi:hypothetical protein
MNYTEIESFASIQTMPSDDFWVLQQINFQIYLLAEKSAALFNLINSYKL